MNRARREAIDAPDRAGTAVNGVFVVGMHDSGVELLAEALSSLGLPVLRGAGTASTAARWPAFNERLLAAAGGSEDAAPDASPLELVHTLVHWSDEARTQVSADLAQLGADPRHTPWVWADSGLSFLAPFWSEVLDSEIAVILVHRDPRQVVAAGTGAMGDHEALLTRWARYNRAALVLCSRFPSLVVGYEEMVNQPKATLAAMTEFLGSVGVSVDGDVSQAAERIESLVPSRRHVDPGISILDPSYETLHKVLTELEGSATTGGRMTQVAPLIDVTAEFYDEDYYGTSYDQGGVPYRREEKVWVDLMERVAASIVRTLRPVTALDVGCAIGMLVEALRDRGVDARGFDVSSWAIGQVPAHLQPYCWVGSVTEEIEGDFDLITCVEVLEHLPPSLAEEAVGNLCRHGRAVLFSSTPDDFAEPTHLNVEPSGYWANLFLRHGYVRDLDFDASFLAPHAMLFRHGDVDASALVGDYERALWRADTRLRGSAEQRDRLQAQVAAHEDIRGEVKRLREALRNEELRRAAESLAAFDKVREFEAGQRRLAGLLQAAESELDAVRNTKTFRYTATLRRVYERLRRRPTTQSAASARSATQPPDGSYQRWVELYDTIDDDVRRQIDVRLRTMVEHPAISVAMPVFNPPVDMLRDAIESVRSQIYPNWELSIADDCSTDPDVRALLTEYQESDSRIKVIRRAENGHISAASNSALDLVTNSWVACLDHDDVLAPHALAMVALAIAEHPDAGLLYSDEDKLDQSGIRRDPYFKPDFDPLLLLGQNFVSHLSVFRKDLVDRAGGYREGYEGSQDWDLTLRVTELLDPRQVIHIPHVLYHWRVHATSTASLVTAKPYAVEAGQRAVADHLERMDRDARVERIGQIGFNRVSWRLPGPPPRVSVVVETTDGPHLPRCLNSLLAFTMYPDFEVVVVDNSSRDIGTLEYLRGNDHRVTVVRADLPGNHSAVKNLAIAQTSGDVVCFLSDNTEVISGEWLAEMVAQLWQPGVGAVGAKLYYADGRVEHGGMLLGVKGIAGRAHRLSDRLSVGYFGQLQLAHRMSAVSEACVVVRREAWAQVQGFNESALPDEFSDVDFCLRLREAGWDVVWTPYAELYHHESQLYEREKADTESFARAATYMETKWGFRGLRRDPYYNLNLSLDAEDYSLAWPPRGSYGSQT